jgi:RNA polymerase sigma factor (sigma-70 family)
MAEAALQLRPSRGRGGALRLLGDDRLARMAAAGNRNAFAAIYERHHQALYRYCRSILGSDEDAQDALQNTMLKALNAIPGEERTIALRPWLFRVAHNEAISLVRRRSPAEAPLDEANAAGSEVDPATRERLRTLLADMAALPERQRSALVMRELSGLSYREIAAALDTSPAAAKQAVYEARVTLHELTEGREMECDQARKAISVRDGRVLRGRKLRAHLRSCQSCRAFRVSLNGRSADLALLAPPLPAAAAAGLLHGLLGGGEGGGGGVAALLGGTGGQTLVGTAGMKAVTAAVVVVAGAGAVDVATHATGIPNLGGDGISPDSGQRSGGAADQPSSRSDSQRGATGAGQDESSDRGAGGGSSAHPGEAPGKSGSAPGLTGTVSGQASITPGQSGTTPGQSGTTPGQSGATPGHGGSPPGQAGTSPGQSGTTPGQSGTTPGNWGAAPGHGGTPPGKGGTPPGQF